MVKHDRPLPMSKELLTGEGFAGLPLDVAIGLRGNAAGIAHCQLDWLGLVPVVATSFAPARRECIVWPARDMPKSRPFLAAADELIVAAAWPAPRNTETQKLCDHAATAGDGWIEAATALNAAMLARRRGESSWQSPREKCAGDSKN